MDRTDEPEVMSDEDATEFIRQVIANSEAGGMREDEIRLAYDHFVEMFVDHGLIQLWLDKRATVTWDEQLQDLRFRLTS